jgi:cobalt-zinc-cadmium resistance protein CzcA
MSDVAETILKTIAQIEGATDAKMEIVGGLPSILVTPDRFRAARLGISSRSILDILTMTRGGQTVGRVREGERVFDLSLRIGGERVADPQDFERLPVATMGETLVPLAMVAHVDEERTVVQIGREQMRRRLIVQCNVRGRDIVGFVQEAQSRVADLALPKTAEVSWGGQFQNYHRAKSDLLKLVPVSFGIIAVMLAIAFHSFRFMLVTLLSLPFALAGGVAALVLRGLPFSIPAGVGFIALAGVAVMNGVVMTNHLRERPESEAAEERVFYAATASLRAIFSTALVASVGYVPAALATGMGAEVQRPLATVVIGGIVAAMLLSLVALPAMLLLSLRLGARPRERT